MIGRRKLLIIFTTIAILTLIGYTIYSFVSSNTKDISIEKMQAKCETHFATYDVIEKNINDKKLKLLVADTETKRNYGLMNIKSKKEICENDGMMFVFSNPGIQTFWNQNTLVDLKLYWMFGDKVIREDKLVNITDNGMKIYSSILPVNVVVEVIR